MTFRGHLVGGMVAGVAAATATGGLGLIEPGEYGVWLGVASTGVLFSLVPDLDTASVPQRWFFKGVFALILYLACRGQYETATLVALAAMLPVLDHHRGWTHGRLSPLVMPLALGVVYEYWRVSRVAEGGEFEVEMVAPSHLAFLAAAVVGWYTHLFLDGVFRIFPRDGR